jgi:hypothetical protein
LSPGTLDWEECKIKEPIAEMELLGVCACLAPMMLRTTTRRYRKISSRSQFNAHCA